MLSGRAALTLALTLASAAATAQVVEPHSYRGRSSFRIASDLVELVVLTGGGSIASITLPDDGEALNPLWDSLRGDRQQGRAERESGAVGHFVCVDGFGPPSEQERAAGLQGHGEAHRLEWSTEFAGAEDGAAVLRQRVMLPRVRETLRREIRVARGESVAYVRSTLESLLDFDRPVNWAEHATIGSPFLDRGVTVVDISPARAITRPRDAASRNGLAHRLASGTEFEWPQAPARAGGTVDLRAAPEASHSLDHTGHRLDPDAEWSWVTALHPGKRLLLGYLFRAAEFPWLQTWEHYPRDGLMARGLEFGTQAFDLPRRDVITQGRLFDTPLYRWLPARSTIRAGYLVFLARTPEGFLGVDRVEWESGVLRLTDSRSGQRVELRAEGTI